MTNILFCFPVSFCYCSNTFLPSFQEKLTGKECINNAAISIAAECIQPGFTEKSKQPEELLHAFLTSYLTFGLRLIITSATFKKQQDYQKALMFMILCHLE